MIDHSKFGSIKSLADREEFMLWLGKRKEVWFKRKWPKKRRRKAGVWSPGVVSGSSGGWAVGGRMASHSSRFDLPSSSNHWCRDLPDSQLIESEGKTDQKPIKKRGIWRSKATLPAAESYSTPESGPDSVPKYVCNTWIRPLEKAR